MKIGNGKNTKRRIILAIGIAALLAAAAIAATVGAKYVKEIRIPCRLIIRAGLADEIAVLEHEPLRLSDGTYSLDPEKEVSESEFVLMPGVDAVRDPFIRIKGKSAVPAFVYVEVVSTLDEKASFSLSDDWEKLEGVSGKNGGSVYAYFQAISSESSEDLELSLLDNEAVIVSHTYIAADGTETELSFHPYMAEAEEGRNAADCFDEDKIGFGDTGKYVPAPQGDVGIIDGKAVIGDIGYSVYVRAAVIVNWKDEGGNILARNAKEGADYSFAFGPGWFKADDGWYYYSYPVESEGETSLLISDFTAIAEGSEGSSLSADISAEIIQQAGLTDDEEVPTVTAVWGCTVQDDGTITK